MTVTFTYVRVWVLTYVIRGEEGKGSSVTVRTLASKDLAEGELREIQERHTLDHSNIFETIYEEEPGMADQLNSLLV